MNRFAKSWRRCGRQKIVLFAACTTVLWSAGVGAQVASTPGADVASLEERELGQPYLENGERVIYDRALPFLAAQGDGQAHHNQGDVLRGDYFSITLKVLAARLTC